MTATSYLRSIQAVRDRTSLLLKFPQHLHHFDLHLDQIDNVVNNILLLIVRDYPSPDDIPPHTRGRHFEASSIPGKPKIDRLGALVKRWTDDSVHELEIVKRLIDLYVVSVLLDAGAGNKWIYHPADEPQSTYNRSEGLALASLDWFVQGGFSSNPSQPYQADAQGLSAITPEKLQDAFQYNEITNYLVGVPGRAALLQRLGVVCTEFPQYFGTPGRPGNMVDFILNHPSASFSDDLPGQTIVDLDAIWEVVMEGLSGVWPATRTKLDGISLGDVWPCKALAGITSSPLCPAEVKLSPEADSLIAFHKLSQWLTYSLFEPLSRAKIEFRNKDRMTGLAEYRNGGLFVDMGVITLKPTELSKHRGKIPRFDVFDDVVVEWRALTVALLDVVGKKVQDRLGMTNETLPLVKILEAGTWKAGREIAARLRPDTKGPPIEINSDGTVF